MNKMAVVMGSASDAEVVSKATAVLDRFGAEYEVHVFSAHRTPDEAKAFAESARQKNIGAIIAAAGMAAHLAGAIAANTTLPVVGIPVKSGAINGLDALLSTVQMPSGIPVATVAVDGAANAALLCLEMLAIYDDGLADKLEKYRHAEKQNVLAKNAEIEKRFV